MKVLISADMQSFRMVGRTWKASFPANRIDGQIKLYTLLVERKSGRYAGHYAPVLASLVKARDRLRKYRKVQL